MQSLGCTALPAVGFYNFSRSHSRPFPYQICQPVAAHVACPAMCTGHIKKRPMSNFKSHHQSSVLRQPGCPLPWRQEASAPGDWKSVSGYCQRGKGTKSQQVQACFPDFKHLSLCRTLFLRSLQVLIRKTGTTASLLPSPIFLTPSTRVNGEGAGSCWGWVQHNPALPGPNGSSRAGRAMF